VALTIKSFLQNVSLIDFSFIIVMRNDEAFNFLAFVKEKDKSIPNIKSTTPSNFNITVM